MSRKIGCLDIFAGEEAGKRILLKNLSVFEAGRSAGNHICLKDPSVAMSHFRICREGLSYSIYDLGTKRGVLVNGQRRDKAVLKAGDIIQAGEMQIAFLLVDEASDGRLARELGDARSPMSPHEPVIQVANHSQRVIGAVGHFRSVEDPRKLAAC